MKQFKSTSIHDLAVLGHLTSYKVHVYQIVLFFGESELYGLI